MPAPAAPPAKRKRPSLCHSCKREVVWVLLDGKRQPLDHIGAELGDVALEDELFPLSPAEGDRLQRATFVSGVRTHYRRHIESCPDAPAWRERWKKNAPRPFSTVRGKKTR